MKNDIVYVLNYYFISWHLRSGDIIVNYNYSIGIPSIMDYRSFYSYIDDGEYYDKSLLSELKFCTK